MSHALLCPACGEAHLVHDEREPARCIRCDRSFIEETPSARGPRATHQVPPRPLLVTLELLWSTAAVVVGLFFVAAVAATDTPLRIDGLDLRPSGTVGTLHAYLVLAVLLCSGFIVWGVWRERSWSRHAIFASWLAFAAIRGSSPVAVREDRWWMLALALAYVLFAGWYLYLKPNVVAYFEALHTRRHPR